MYKKKDLVIRAQAIVNYYKDGIAKDLGIDISNIELIVSDSIEDPGLMGRYGANTTRDGFGFGKVVKVEDEIVFIFPHNLVYNGSNDFMKKPLSALRRKESIFDAHIILTLAHELRHVYQNRNNEISTFSSYLPYDMQPHEKDAKEYASNYLKKLGIKDPEKAEVKIVSNVSFAIPLVGMALVCGVAKAITKKKQ